MQSTPDEVLIGRIANGDRLAMQVLYARYHVRVFRFVVRLVRDEATAEDVISEVFLDVWRQAGRFEGRSTVSTWLLAIGRFKAISAIRRRSDEELGEEAAAAIEDPSDDPATADCGAIAVAKRICRTADRRSIRRECLDYVVVFGERHLRDLLKSYQRYYNEARTHLSLSKDAPVSRGVQVVGRILCLPILRELHHQYIRI